MGLQLSVLLKPSDESLLLPKTGANGTHAETLTGQRVDQLRLKAEPARGIKSNLTKSNFSRILKEIDEKL